jgi:hypothetical protein
MSALMMMSMRGQKSHSRQADHKIQELICVQTERKY